MSYIECGSFRSSSSVSNDLDIGHIFVLLMDL